MLTDPSFSVLDTGTEKAPTQLSDFLDFFSNFGDFVKFVSQQTFPTKVNV